MALYTGLFCSLIAFTVVRAQSPSCTTLQPVFEPPVGTTSTRFLSTATKKSTVECSGCSLSVSTFGGATTQLGPQNATTTVSATTSTVFECASPGATLPSCSTSVPQPSPTGSSAPLPPVNASVATLISDLTTAILYAELISNDGFAEDLCSVINPANLDAIQGQPAINGTAVRSEVCALAEIDSFDACLAETVTKLNQVAVPFLFQALFALQVAGNYAGGTNLATLCSEINDILINNIFIGFTNEATGTQIKNFVCAAASAAAEA